MAKGDHVSAHATIKVDNFCYQDEIQRRVVRREKRAAKLFPSRWGFVCDHIKETEQKLIESRKEDSTKEKVKIPDDLVPRPATPIEMFTKIGQSPSYPKTSSAVIGYRSSQRDCNLDNFANRARAKGSLYKQLGWGFEGCNM